MTAYCWPVRRSGGPTRAPGGRSGAVILRVRQALWAPGRQGLLLLSLVLICGGASLNSGGYSPVALGCELIAILLLALACSAEDRPLGRWSWFAGVGALSVCDLLYTLGWSPLEAVFAGLALARSSSSPGRSLPVSGLPSPWPSRRLPPPAR